MALPPPLFDENGYLRSSVYTPEQNAQAVEQRAAQDLERMGNFGRGVYRGIDQLQGGLYNAAGQVLEPFAPGATKVAFNAGLRNQQEAQRYLTPDDIAATDQIDSLGTGLRYVVGKLGENLPNMAVTVPAAIAARTAMSRVPGLNSASPLSKNVLATSIGAVPMQLGEMAGSMREDPAIMESTTPMQRLGHAAKYAALTSPMEAADEALLLTRATGAGKAVKNIFKDGVKQAAKDTVKHVAKAVPEAALTEGLPEVLQQKTQQAMLSSLNPQRDTSGDTKELKESFFGGWAAGGGSSVIGRGADVAWAQGRGAVEAVKGLLTPKTLPDSLKDSDDKSVIDWDNKDNNERNYQARRLADDAIDNEKAPENVREAAKSFYEKLEGGAGDAWRTMADALGENEYARRAGDGVRNFMGAAKRTAARRWKREDDAVEQHGSGLMDEIKQGIGTQWDDLKEAAKGGWDTLSEKLGGAKWPGKDSKVVDNFLDAYRKQRARSKFDPNALDDGNTIDGEYTKRTEKFSAASDKLDQAMYKDFGSYLDKRGATARDTKLKSGLFNTLKEALRDEAWDELPWTQLEGEFGGSDRARKAVSSLRDNMVRAGQLEHIDEFETLLKATMEDGAGAEQAQREVVMRYGQSFIGAGNSRQHEADAKEAVRGIRNFLMNAHQMKPEQRDAIHWELKKEFGTNLDKVLQALSPKRFQEGEFDFAATEEGDEDAAVGRFKEQSGESYTPGVRFLGRGVESARKHIAADKPVDPEQKDIIKQHGGFWKLGHPNPKTRAEIQAEFKQTAADLRRDGYYVRELSPLEYAKEAGVDPEKIASHLSKGLKEEDKLTVDDLKDHPARMLAVEERERGKDPLSLDVDDLKNLAEKTVQSLKAIPDELPIRDPAKATAVEKALYTKHGGGEQRKQMRELGLEHGVKLERRGGVTYLKNNARHGGNGVFEVLLKRTEAQEAAWQEAHKTRKATDKEIAKDLKERTKHISVVNLISLMRQRSDSEIEDRTPYGMFKLGITALRDLDTVEKIIVRDVWGREQKEDQLYGVFGPYFRLERSGGEDVTLGWAHKKAQNKAKFDAEHLKAEADGENDLGDIESLRTVNEASQRIDTIDKAIADAKDELEKIRAKQEDLGTAIDEMTGQNGAEVEKKREAAQVKLDKLNGDERELLDEIDTLNNYLDEANDKFEELQGVEDTISGEGDREGMAGGNRRRKYEGMEETGLDGGIKETARKFNEDGTPLNPYGKPGDNFKGNVSKNYNGVPLRLMPGVSGKHFVGGSRKALGVVKKIRALLSGEPTISYHLERAADYLAHSAAAQKAGDTKAREAATNAAAYIIVETLADEKALIEGEGNLLPEGAEKQKMREKYAEMTRLGALAIDRAKEYLENKAEMDALIAPYTPRREYLNEGQRATLAAQKKAREAERKAFEKNFGERWGAHSYFLDTLERKTTEELIRDGKARAARIERFEDKPNLTANLAELIRLMDYEQDLARAEIKKRRGDKPAQAAEQAAEILNESSATPATQTATDEGVAESKKGKKSVAEKAAEAKAAAAERKASYDAAMAIPPTPAITDTALSSVTRAAKAPLFAREKELAKASGADFVYAPTGVRGSFASRLAEGAKAEGRLIDPKGTEDISGKKVYVSVPGASRGFDGMEKAAADVLALLERGARVRTDNEKNASTKHNKAGEGVLREALIKAGMIEANMGLFSEWRAPETAKAEAGRTSTADTAVEARGPSAKWRERLNHLLNQSVHGVLQDNERVENARLPGFFNALPEHYAHLKTLDAQGSLNPRSELPEGATLRDKNAHRKANPERYAAADAFEEMQKLIKMANNEPDKLAGVVKKLATVPGSVTEKDVEAFAKALKQAEATDAPVVASQPDATETLTQRQRAARKAAETRKRNAEAKKAAEAPKAEEVKAEETKVEEAPKAEEAPKTEAPTLEAPKAEEAPKADGTRRRLNEAADKFNEWYEQNKAKVEENMRQAEARLKDIEGMRADFKAGISELIAAVKRAWQALKTAWDNKLWDKTELVQALRDAWAALGKAVANGSGIAAVNAGEAIKAVKQHGQQFIHTWQEGRQRSKGSGTTSAQVGSILGNHRNTTTEELARISKLIYEKMKDPNLRSLDPPDQTTTASLGSIFYKPSPTNDVALQKAFAALVEVLKEAYPSIKIDNASMLIDRLTYDAVAAPAMNFFGIKRAHVAKLLTGEPLPRNTALFIHHEAAHLADALGFDKVTHAPQFASQYNPRLKADFIKGFGFRPVGDLAREAGRLGRSFFTELAYNYPVAAQANMVLPRNFSSEVVAQSVAYYRVDPEWLKTLSPKLHAFAKDVCAAIDSGDTVKLHNLIAGGERTADAGSSAKLQNMQWKDGADKFADLLAQGIGDAREATAEDIADLTLGLDELFNTVEGLKTSTREMLKSVAPAIRNRDVEQLKRVAKHLIDAALTSLKALGRIVERFVYSILTMPKAAEATIATVNLATWAGMGYWILGSVNPENMGAHSTANAEAIRQDAGTHREKVSKLSEAFAKAFSTLSKGAAYLGKDAMRLLDAVERGFHNVAEAIRNQDWSRKGLAETLGKAVTALRKAVANAPAEIKQAFNKLRESARELIQKYRQGPDGGGHGGGVKYSAAATTVNRGVLSWANDVMRGKPNQPVIGLVERPAAALRMAGLHRPILIDLEHARHIFNTHSEVTPEMLAALPGLLNTPRAILKYPNSTGLVLDQRDGEGQPLLIALRLTQLKDGKQVFKVTEVATLFGMEESAYLIAQAAIKGDLIYLPKKEVARLQDLLSKALIASQGVETPTTHLTSRATSRSGAQQAVSSPSSDGYKVSVASDEALRKFTLDPKGDWQASKEAFALPADALARLKGAKFSSSYASGKTVTPEDMKAVAEYVRKVLGPDVAVMLAKELGGNSASWQRNDKGEALIRIALHAANPMSHAHHEAMHEFFQRLLDSGSPAADVLLKAASSAAVQRQIEQFFHEDANYEKIVEALKDPHERVAYMYQLWAAGQLKLGPQTKNVFQKIAAALRKLFGALSADQRAEALMQHFHDGKMNTPSAVAAVLAKDPKLVQDLIDRAAEWLRPVAQGAKEGLWTAQNILTESGNKSFEKIGRLFSTETGGEGESISFFDAKTMKTNQMNDRLWDILQNLDEKDKAAALEGLQRGIESKDPKIASAQQRITKLLEQIHDYMTKDGDKPGPLKVRKIKNYFPRVWDTLAIAENREAFNKMLIEEHLRTTGKPLAPHQANWITTCLTIGKGVEHVNETELSSGYSPFMAAGNERVLDFIKSPEFARFQQKDLVGILTTYVAEAVQKTEYARRFGQNGKTMRKMVLDGVGEAVGDGWDEAVKKAIDQRDTLQNVMKKQGAGPDELTKIMHERGYRYGDILPQHVRDQLTGDARKRYDAFEPKLRQYMRAVMAMEGTLGADINPTLRKWNSGLIVYENMRLLSMSLFSQVIDPLGVLVRGSDVSHAWDTFRRGVAGTIAGWRGKPQMDAAMRLAMKLGIVDAGGYLNSQGNAYSSVYMGKTAQKLNDKLFRWNGVEGFSQGTRVGAMLAAIDFIKHHSSSPEEHSKRWLAELDLKPEDVVLKGNELDYANPKIQQAIFRWVEGAILRPNASMRPSWASDPHWALVFHLKQFTYAMQKVLLERVASEIKHGNYDPAITMLFTYVPAMIAADFMRGIASNGGEEPPWKRKWNFGDYLSEGVQRAGLLGVPQLALDAAQWGPAELAGPVAGQINRVGKQFYKDVAKDRKLDALAAQSKSPKDAARAENFNGVTHAAKRSLRDALPLGAFTKKYVYDEMVSGGGAS